MTEHIKTWHERLSGLDRPTDFAEAQAAKMEAADLRRRIAELEAERAQPAGEAENVALPFVSLSVTLVKALKRLSFAAQTTGGVAGRDDDLVAAIAEAELALKAASGKLAAPPAAANQAGIPEDEITRLRRIAWLIGSIFVHGNFVAETYNERQLEKLLREQGTFWDTLSEFDAAAPHPAESHALGGGGE